jgi:Mor family transcriptional regulator
MTSATSKTRPKVPPPRMPWDDCGDDDIVADILRRVLALAPQFNAELAQRIDREVRETWGGDRPYIARRAGEGTSARNDAIRRDHQAGERTGLLCRRYGLTPRQIQRILRQDGGA